MNVEEAVRGEVLEPHQSIISSFSYADIEEAAGDCFYIADTLCAAFLVSRLVYTVAHIALQTLILCLASLMDPWPVGVW